MSALRARVCLVQPLSRATVRTFSAPSLFSASSRPAARVTPARPPSSAASTPPRRAFRAGARETRGVPRAAGEPPADGWDASPSSTRTSDEPTPAEIPVSFSRDEEDAEASAGEGSSGHDVVGDAREPSSKANETSETSEPLTGPTPTGWDTKPTSIVPNAYFQGEVGYSKFYPPEARDYEYKRKLVVAVDGSLESERAVEWAIQHLCRSGDLLQIVHCCLAGAIDPRLASYYNGPSLMSGDQIRADPRLSVQVNARPEYPERFPKRPMYDDSWAPTHLKEVRVRFFLTGRLRAETGKRTIERPWSSSERLTRSRWPPSTPPPSARCSTCLEKNNNTCPSTSSPTPNCRTPIGPPPSCAPRRCWTTSTRSSEPSTVRPSIAVSNSYLS